MISIVIPTYNAEGTIARLLDSIVISPDFGDCEVLLVDDASEDRTVSIASDYPIKIIKNDVNSGSAKSRNDGVRAASGDTIIFFDSDIILHKDTLTKLISGFKDKESGNALIGIYSKNSASPGLIAEYKALLDFHHWRLVENESVTSFEPRCAIIKKEIFEIVGGFDEKIKGADVEDYEFGYRLLEIGEIYVDKTIQVDHHFPASFLTIVKNFFSRGTSWMQLFLSRKQFDNVVTTKGAGLSCGFAFLSIIFLPGIIITSFAKVSSVLFLISFLLYLLFYRDFFVFVFNEKGIIFCIKAALLQYILSLVLGFAAVKGLFLYFAKGSARA